MCQWISLLFVLTVIEILQESSEERINELIDIGKNGKQINENIDFPSSCK